MLHPPRRSLSLLAAAAAVALLPIPAWADLTPSGPGVALLFVVPVLLLDLVLSLVLFLPWFLLASPKKPAPGIIFRVLVGLTVGVEILCLMVSMDVGLKGRDGAEVGFLLSALVVAAIGLKVWAITRPRGKRAD